MFIMMYIDNYLIIGLNKTYIKDLKVKINKIYLIEDKGFTTQFLRVEIN